MKTLGLDIGTTTISAVVIEDGAVLTAENRRNDSFFTGCQPWEKLQDPAFIRRTALELVEELFEAYPEIARIGVTGQMHGIVYLNRAGEAVSPLYTWQDGRGDQPCGEESWAQRLGRLTGHAVSTGYGLVTHFYNVRNGLVPEHAAVFCTIQDYIAMLLAGASAPVIDASDAASLGLFDVQKGCFDRAALEQAGLDPSMLPALAASPRIGRYRDRADVYAAIGDNQASFLGAVDGQMDRMLVNVGTGSQFSAYSKTYLTCPGLETRPFPGGGYLLAGASLCGGRAYALLERFFRQTAQMLGAPCEDCYGAMAALLAQNEKPDDLPTVLPLFQGTRQEPQLRGSLQNLGTENLTPLHLIWAWMEGMARELFEMFEAYLVAGGAPAQLTGSGNGLRKNPYLQSCVAAAFGQALQMSACEEEAACGAARFAALQN